MWDKIMHRRINEDFSLSFSSLPSIRLAFEHHLGGLYRARGDAYPQSNKGMPGALHPQLSTRKAEWYSSAYNLWSDRKMEVSLVFSSILWISRKETKDRRSTRWLALTFTHKITFEQKAQHKRKRIETERKRNDPFLRSTDARFYILMRGEWSFFVILHFDRKEIKATSFKITKKR